MDLDHLVGVEFAELPDVANWSHEQVAGRVRELVEQREGVLPAAHDEAFLVGEVEREAENAAFLLVGAADILEPPGSPQRTRHSAASTRRRASMGR